MPLIELWKDSSIQFGYISFFSISFPMITTYGLLVNMLLLVIWFYSFSNISRRVVCKEFRSIGIWNVIFGFIIFSSISINTAVLFSTTKGFKDLIHKSYSDYGRYEALLIIVLMEHMLFLLLFVALQISGKVPSWLQKEIKIRKHKEMQYHK